MDHHSSGCYGSTVNVLFLIKHTLRNNFINFQNTFVIYCINVNWLYFNYHNDYCVGVGDNIYMSCIKACLSRVNKCFYVWQTTYYYRPLSLYCMFSIAY